jgi:hypothetical protein
LGKLKLGTSSGSEIFGGVYGGKYYIRYLLRKAYVGKVTALYPSIFASNMMLSSVVLSSKCSSTIYKGAFNFLPRLKSLTFPRSWKYTTTGNGMVLRCESLESISIPNTGVSCGSLSQFAQECSNLKYAHFPSTFKGAPSRLGSECYKIESAIMFMDITDSSYDSLCSDLSCLKHALIFEGVTSLTATFNNCTVIEKITLPSTIQKIGGNTFYGCDSLYILDCTACDSVPTLANTSAFTSTPSKMQILVKKSLAAEWKSATNWVSYGSRIVGVEV